MAFRQIKHPRAVRLDPPAGGTVYLQREDITGIPSHALVSRVALRRGRGVFARLSVHEKPAQIRAFARNDKAQILQEVDEIYTMIPRLKERTTQLAGTLSGGEQQMLAIGRAMLAQPKTADARRAVDGPGTADGGRSSRSSI